MTEDMVRIDDITIQVQLGDGYFISEAAWKALHERFRNPVLTVSLQELLKNMEVDTKRDDVKLVTSGLLRIRQNIMDNSVPSVQYRQRTVIADIHFTYIHVEEYSADEKLAYNQTLSAWGITVPGLPA